MTTAFPGIHEVVIHSWTALPRFPLLLVNRHLTELRLFWILWVWLATAIGNGECSSAECSSVVKMNMMTTTHEKQSIKTSEVPYSQDFFIPYDILLPSLWRFPVE
jgi:hypothetical protein